jgi:hypothetical protein
VRGPGQKARASIRAEALKRRPRSSAIFEFEMIRRKGFPGSRPFSFATPATAPSLTFPPRP